MESSKVLCFPRLSVRTCLGSTSQKPRRRRTRASTTFGNALCDLRRAVHTGATARETHAAAEQPYDSDATEVIASDDEYASAIVADAQKANDERRARSRYWASQSFSITRVKLIQLYSAQTRADELRVTPAQKADLVLA